MKALCVSGHRRTGNRLNYKKNLTKLNLTKYQGVTIYSVIFNVTIILKDRASLSFSMQT